MAGLVSALLIVFAGGYGYHRDELYFLAAGDHLAWGYPDQGPFTPLVAHVMNAVAPGSLTVLRIPSALLAGATSLLAGVIAHELGGSRRAQLIAAGSAAVASVVLVVATCSAPRPSTCWRGRSSPGSRPVLSAPASSGCG